MLHQIALRQIDDKSCAYRNRWVRTDQWHHTNAYVAKHGTNFYYSLFLDMRGVFAVASFFVWACLEKLFGFWNPWAPMNLANTNVQYHAGKFMALVESAKPTLVAVPALSTHGSESFGGKLKHPFTAHPKVCASTGDLVFFAYNMAPPHCVLSAIDAKGRKMPSVSVPAVRRTSMMHDFAITRNFVVLFDGPIVFDEKNCLRNRPAFEWDERVPMKFHVVRRDAIGDAAVRADGDSGAFDDHALEKLRAVPSQTFTDGSVYYLFHVANAWEEGDEIVLVAMRHERVRMDFDKWTGGEHEHEEKGAKLWRWRFNTVTGEMRDEALSRTIGEFPIIDEKRYGGVANRFVYYAVNSFDDEPAAVTLTFKGLAKFDLQRNAETVLRFSNDEEGGEFVFVPRVNTKTGKVGAADDNDDDDDSRPEDDGYLVGFVYVKSLNKSHFVVVDAKTLKVVSRNAISQRVPHGFHGKWISNEEVALQRGYA